jgi:hypothetical protein
VAIKAGVLENMNAGKLKPSSIDVYLRALNAFIRWGKLEEHLKPNQEHSKVGDSVRFPFLIPPRQSIT